MSPVQAGCRFGGLVAQVPAVVEEYGGRCLARSAEVSPVVGDWRPAWIVLIESDGIEPVQELFASKGYQALVLLYEQSATTRAIIVEGYGL